MFKFLISPSILVVHSEVHLIQKRQSVVLVVNQSTGLYAWDLFAPFVQAKPTKKFSSKKIYLERAWPRFETCN